jgi:hypothetical protein
MYLHLGNNVVVPTESIVAVFDLDNSSQSLRTREFLAKAEKSGNVVAIGEDLPKSFVICSDERGETVYLSQLMSATLLKRSEGDLVE